MKLLESTNSCKQHDFSLFNIALTACRRLISNHLSAALQQYSQIFVSYHHNESSHFVHLIGSLYPSLIGAQHKIWTAVKYGVLYDSIFLPLCPFYATTVLNLLIFSCFCCEWKFNVFINISAFLFTAFHSLEICLQLIGGGFAYFGLFNRIDLIVSWWCSHISSALSDYEVDTVLLVASDGDLIARTLCLCSLGEILICSR